MSLKPCDGTPITITSAPLTASSRSEVARNRAGSWKPGRYSRLTRVRSISSASSVRRAHRTVGALRAVRAATAVPQDPAPITAAISSTCDTLPAGLVGYRPPVDSAVGGTRRLRHRPALGPALRLAVLRCRAAADGGQRDDRNAPRPGRDRR